MPNWAPPHPTPRDRGKLFSCALSNTLMAVDPRVEYALTRMREYLAATKPSQDRAEIRFYEAAVKVTKVLENEAKKRGMLGTGDIALELSRAHNYFQHQLAEETREAEADRIIFNSIIKAARTLGYSIPPIS